MKIEFFQQIFEECPNIKCLENPSSGSQVAPRGQTDRQTDMTKLTVVFRNFANAPNSCLIERQCAKLSGTSLALKQK